ncbi:unnamed protein product [Cylindrotheca closterium]|uniref:UBA domain-containing protein n=1 Tax=Cylindrotheca closterium TaxID=2856 RepID=A0AAD2JKF6_9STRA|nr:unnamed protein product [Cylindrotheca closterium]
MKTWNREVIRLEHTKAYTTIDDQMYLSHCTPAQNESLLQRDGITHVLNTAIELETQRFVNVHVLHLKLYDSPDQQLPLKDSYSHVKARKPNIGPNFGFLSQLQEAEIRLFHNPICSTGMAEYKADNLLEILDGSGKTKEQVMAVLKQTGGNAHVALDMLLD